MTVRTVRIGDILELRRDQVAVDLSSTYTEIGVRSFGHGLFVKEPVTGVDLGDKRVFRIRAGDLIVSNVFAWEGAVAVAGEEHDGLIGSHRFMTWSPIDDSEVEVDVHYLQHYFTSDQGLTLLRQASPGSAGRNRTLSIRNFEAIEIPLPPIGEQRRVAAHLDHLEDLESREHRVVGMRLEVMARLQEHTWPGDGVALRELVERVTRPIMVDSSDTYRMQGVRWYGAGLFTRETRSGEELSAKTVYRVDEGDLVYNRLFAWKQSFAIAKHSGGVVSNEFPTFRIDEQRVLPRVLLALVLGQDFTRQVNDASTGSTPTSRNRLKEQDFLSLQVALPPWKMQHRLTAILEKTDAVRRLHGRLERLSSAILPAARNEIFNAMP